MEATLVRKIKPIQEVLDDKRNEYQLRSDAPCAYLLEELESRLNEAEQDFELKKGTPHDSIKRK